EAHGSVLDKLCGHRDALLSLIPVCPVHGECIPHALEWIALAKEKVGDLEPELREKEINKTYANTVVSALASDERGVPPKKELEPIVAGDTIVLRGKVRFGQDHQFTAEDFGEGKEFAVCTSTGERVKLKTHGYGIIGQGGGSYGNGAIYISAEELVKQGYVFAEEGIPPVTPLGHKGRGKSRKNAIAAIKKRNHEEKQEGK
ncbi:MAG: hypothetical protein NUV49_04320, partial [Patescibacteria group bacterium]|nr:hypothetical protein [Patescibacteria group bacterium]